MSQEFFYWWYVLHFKSYFSSWYLAGNVKRFGMCCFEREHKFDWFILRLLYTYLRATLYIVSNVLFNFILNIFMRIKSYVPPAGIWYLWKGSSSTNLWSCFLFFEVYFWIFFQIQMKLQWPQQEGAILILRTVTTHLRHFLSSKTSYPVLVFFWTHSCVNSWN